MARMLACSLDGHGFVYKNNIQEAMLGKCPWLGSGQDREVAKIGKWPWSGCSHGQEVAMVRKWPW